MDSGTVNNHGLPGKNQATNQSTGLRNGKTLYGRTPGEHRVLLKSALRLSNYENYKYTPEYTCSKGDNIK